MNYKTSDDRQLTFDELKIEFNIGGVEPLPQEILDALEVTVVPEVPPVVDPVQELADAKLWKNNEINISWNDANNGTFVYDGHVVDSNPKAYASLNAVATHIGLMESLPTDFPNEWKLHDNTVIPIPDVDTFKLLFMAMTDARNANFIKAQSLKTALKDASTLEEVSAITWDTPEVPAVP